MSYQVLARKWRPQNFSELVGQQQTAQALMNALESQRLHHAYLFTGTRGVGKTTIARIIAKSLNCETGITSNPCGECSSCVEITQGNFVDLLEIDAASKTKVEDTRELLDNVQYRPTRGRYKVYLIDEVHMLSGHSFNALLKTLEEPPPHVIFLLATTDPQKLPVTVLSRCLQFHLRRMQEDEIVCHLDYLLKAEAIAFEAEALPLIAEGADGSMRDALSLLDQAIAYCGGDIKTQVVLDMLGSIDKEYAFQLLAAVQSSDASSLMQVIDKIAQFSPDYEGLLADWLNLLHQIAVCQATGINNEPRITDLAASFSGADLQLFYQLSLQARRDIGYAPHPRQGFEMAMLRIMAFKPQSEPQGNSPQGAATKSESKKKQAPIVATKTNQQTSGQQGASNSNANLTSQARMQEVLDQQVHSRPEASLSNFERMPVELAEVAPEIAAEAPLEAQAPVTDISKPRDIRSLKESAKLQVVVDNSAKTPVPDQQEQQLADETKVTDAKKILSDASHNLKDHKPLALKSIDASNWYQVVAALAISGHALQLALNSIGSAKGERLHLGISPKMESLFNESARLAIEQDLKNYFSNNRVKIEFEFIEAQVETPKQRNSRLHELALDEAQASLLAEPQVKYLLDRLQGTLARESIKLASSE